MSHPIREVLLEAGYPLIDTGDWWRTVALYRGGSSPTALSVNKRTGNWKDFSANTWGTPEQLVKLIKGKEVDFSTYEATPEQAKLKTTKVYPPEILKRLLPQFDFFKKRGISEGTLRLFQAGMAHSGKLNRRICFPIFDRTKRIIGFAGRWFSETPFGNTPKWKLLSPKTDFLYPCHLNETLLRERKEIIIVESVGDVLALWDAGIQNVMCVFGTSLSSKQLSYILSLDPTCIIIATNNDVNNDEAGQKAARGIKAKLSKQFDQAEIIIRLPSEKDFGVMTKQQIQSWYEKI